VSRVTVIIDGETILDEDLYQWQQKPPAFLAELADRKTRPAPHLKAIGIALVDALIAQKPVTIDACTDILGWTMTVTHEAG
jgi:hypothetical protein